MPTPVRAGRDRATLANPNSKPDIGDDPKIHLPDVTWDDRSERGVAKLPIRSSSQIDYWSYATLDWGEFRGDWTPTRQGYGLEVITGWSRQVAPASQTARPLQPRSEILPSAQRG